MFDLVDYTVSKSGTLINAIDKIERNHSRTVIVVDCEKVVGVLSEGDILRALLRGSDVYAPLVEYMQLGFCYLHERNLDKAFNLMQSRGINLVPIVHDDFRLKGIVSMSEVLDWVKSRIRS